MTDTRVHVVFSAEMGIGGSELNAVRTAERLDRSRFRVSVVCGDRGPLTQRYEAAGIPVHPFPVRNLYGPTSARVGLRLARFLSRERAMIFHAHDVYSNIFGTFYARLARTPVRIASRRWWNYVPRPGLNTLNRWASRAAHCVLANSPAIARMMVEKEGVPEERIAIVPNFLDDEAFAPLSSEERHRVLTQLGIPAGALVVGCVASLTQVKNHALLIKAAGRLTSSHPGAHFVLFGEGPQRLALEAMVRELDLVTRVHLPGQWLRPWNLHNLFDISVLCSRSEGFPNSIVEAMAAAKPVVATRVGGCVDAVLDEETGVLIPAGDAGQLAAALDRLLAGEALRERMGAFGRGVAQAQYPADQVIKQLEALYEYLLDHGRPPMDYSAPFSS